MKRQWKMAIAGLVALVVSMVGATNAQAADWGGVINPAGCSDAYTVKSVPFKDWLGRTVGTLEIRWSWSCYVQWARINAYGGAYKLSATIKEVAYPSNQAGTDAYNVKQAWTRGIILKGGTSSRVCAYGDLLNGPSYVRLSAVVCA